MDTRFFPLAAALCAASLGAPAAAQAGDAIAPAACAPRIVDGWLRSPPMPMPMLAGFARIENPCDGDVAVTGAESGAFARVDLHETTVVDGVSRMRPVARLAVPAGGEAVLQPGGLHLMLMQPATPLAEGDVARVELLLGDGRRIGADFSVRAPGAR